MAQADASTCRAGWLALMISEESVDTFVAVHNAMLQVLKVRSSFQSFCAAEEKGRTC